MFRKILAFVGLLVFSLSTSAASISTSGIITNSMGAFTFFAPIGTTLEGELDWNGANLISGITELSSGQCFSSDASGVPGVIGSPTCTDGYGVSPVLTTGQTIYDGTPAAPGSTFDQIGTSFDGTIGFLRTVVYSEIFNQTFTVDYIFDGEGTGTFTADGGALGTASGEFSVVPLPAAAWLFISALGGLVVAKRKQLKA